MVKVKNQLTMTRLQMVAALIFMEAFLGPVHNILATGVWPTPLQVADILCTAVLQVATMFLALLEREASPSKPEEPKPS